MDISKRYLTAEIRAVLATKMVFLGGPRQVGKTTLALSLLGSGATERHPAYLNWDHPLIPPRFFQVHRGTKQFASGKVRVLPFTLFCRQMRMP